MKFSLALAGLCAALPVFGAPVAGKEVAKRTPGGINYTQNYNGAAAGFTSNLNTGAYSLKWSGSTDVVVGLGWSTGSARFVSSI